MYLNKMMNDQKPSVGQSAVPYRRRGRPAGKNRIPLSLEERRARNAQYERERRSETAEVMSQLIETANCDPNISNAELLATVISRIQRATKKKSEDLTDLERVNANLEAQIATLQDRLGLDDAALELLDREINDLESDGPHSNSESIDNANNCNKNCNLRKKTKKRKRSEQLSSESIQQVKRTKTRSETRSVDLGIELRGISPALCAQNQEDQLPVEITDEQEHDLTQAHIELQTELYNEIYNSESQSSVELTPEWFASLPIQTQSIPSIESLSRSLIKVPSIIPPQQEPPNNQEHTQAELTSLQNVELPCEFDFTNEYSDFLQQNDDQLPTFDFLTDTEKRLLSDWIDADLLETSEFGVDTNQVRSYPIDDISGY